MERLAWRAFLNSRDQSKSVEDFIQDAQVAIIQASRRYRPKQEIRQRIKKRNPPARCTNGSASFNTYAVTAVVNTFSKTRSREISKQPTRALWFPESVQADLFFLKVVDVLSSKGNKKAKKLVQAFLDHCDGFNRCSLAELKRASRLNNDSFKEALAQLSRF